MPKEDLVSNEDLDEAAAAAAADGEDHSAEEEEDEHGKEAGADADEGGDEDELEPDEPTDNAVRSKLGRRVSELEGKIETLGGEIKDMFSDFIKSNKEEKEVEEETLEFDEDEPLTAKDLMRILEHRDKQKTKAEDDYGTDYRGTIEALRKETKEYGDDVEEAIMKEFVANHNKKRSDNGSNDAEANFRAAERAVLRKVAFGKKNPFERNEGADNKKEEEPTGGNLNGPGKTGKKKINFKLDPAAKDFVESTGMKEEDVESALEGGAPTYLGGR